MQTMNVCLAAGSRISPYETRLSFALTRSRTINAMFLSYRAPANVRPRSFIIPSLFRLPPRNFPSPLSILNFRHISKYVIALRYSFLAPDRLSNIVIFEKRKTSFLTIAACLRSTTDLRSIPRFCVWHSFVKSRLFLLFRNISNYFDTEGET